MMTYQQVEDCLARPKGASYVRVDNGARAGAVARIVGRSESNVFALYVEWDGRPTKIPLEWSNLTLLYNYAGPTVWAFNRNATVPKGPEDSVGQVFEVHDLVYYRLRKSNHFGIVVEIKPTGGVYVRRVPITGHASGSQRVERIISRQDTLIIRDNLKATLMLKKLKNG